MSSNTSGVGCVGCLVILAGILATAAAVTWVVLTVAVSVLGG